MMRPLCTIAIARPGTRWPATSCCAIDSNWRTSKLAGSGIAGGSGATGRTLAVVKALGIATGAPECCGVCAVEPSVSGNNSAMAPNRRRAREGFFTLLFMAFAPASRSRGIIAPISGGSATVGNTALIFQALVDCVAVRNPPVFVFTFVDAPWPVKIARTTPVQLARIRSAARSAIIIVGALVLPPIRVGITDASTTRRPSTPRTRSCGSTTDSASVPMRQVPTG